MIKRHDNTTIDYSSDRSWLDSSGRFIFGKYKGSLAEDIVQDDSSYIYWIINNVENITEEDREVLSQLLQYGRRRH